MAANKGDQISSLRKRVSKIDVEVEEIKADQRRQSTQINQLIQERDRLNAMIEQLVPKKLTVTDHALLRYLERVMGIDIEGIRNSIVNEKVQAIVDTLGDTKAPLGNGVYAVIKNHSVVTIATSDMVVKRITGGKRTPRDRSARYDEGDDDLLQANGE